MKYKALIIGTAAIITLSCGQKEVKGDFSFAPKEDTAATIRASKVIDLENKGVGPISSVELSREIDVAMANKGQALYEEKCTACHKVGSTFIGPPPDDILERRTPEWIMNMILNPDGMIKSDPLAKALFMEFNGQLMTNQNISEEGAREILEYFRTI